MNQFHKLLRWAWSILVVCTLAFAMAGCEGDDGAQGPAGPAGPAGADGADGADGPPGPGAEITPLESCGVCHGEGNFASAPAAHALNQIEQITNVGFEVSGADLLINFDLLVDGVLTAGYDDMNRGYRSDGTTRTTISDTLTLADNGGGNYTITVAGGAAFADVNHRYLFRVSIANLDENLERATRVYGYGDFPASPFATGLAALSTDCDTCHGPEGIGVHGGYFAVEDGLEPCRTCHGQDGGTRVYARLGIAAHKYHNNVWDPDEHITYPTYMTNCSVCHNDEAGFLAAVNDMPVYGEGCLSCHGEMTYWFTAGQPLDFHLTQPADIDCAGSQCHAVGGAATTLVTVTDFHNGLSTERAGLIWNGKDAAVSEAERFTWQITGIVDDGVDLAISWTATYDTVGVDPCNATVGAAAPVFFALPGVGSGGTFSMLFNYAQGGDYILGQDGRPGYGSSVNLTVDNTSCVGNVATTTVPVEVVDATYGRVAIQGKPGVVSPADATALLRVRVPTPTFDWELGTSNPAPARRGVVDTDACLGCHVGSLYQHGGNRVDNVDVCMQCHNAAANEKFVRVDMGVDASEAYDGKVGETYELKTMLHRIHSANVNFADRGETPVYNPPYLVYRGRGIYAFAAEGDVPPNWEDGGVVGCSADEIARGERDVFGSDPLASSSCQPHNYHNPTFPRSVNHCAACHVEGFSVIPDQAVTMATTVDPGEEPWINQLDDVLQGAGATACTSCHYNSAARGHAYQNGWEPQDFPMGRETIIDAAF